MAYSKAFLSAISHAMLYEVGGFWNESHPAVASGSIATPADRKATGYVNDPIDAGGETKFGVARNANPSVDIARLNWEGAKSIYYDKYWIAGKCDKLPADVAIMHFDACINHGVGRASKFLQESVGAVQDGVIGPKTLAAIEQANSAQLLTKYAASRRDFYNAIVKNKPAQVKFLNGWMRRVNEVEAYAKKF